MYITNAVKNTGRDTTVTEVVNWRLCKRYNYSDSNKWYGRRLEKVTKDENTKILWDYGIWNRLGSEQ